MNNLALDACLPSALHALHRIAYDFWWTWQPGAAEVFRRIDPVTWQRCGGAPLRMLAEMSPEGLDRASNDLELVAKVAELAALLDREHAATFASAPPATPERPAAFFCAEYAIHSSLPIYSGGLGVLAGDFLKQASDRRIPLVAVGLLYRRGYLRQRLDTSGWQHEYWTAESPERLALTSVTRDGEPLIVHVRLGAEDVGARVWRAQVGRVPLYLLDTDVDGNSRIARFITSQLYVADHTLRLMQYAMLGIGGVRALSAMGIDPSIVHLNEGHASLASLALAEEHRKKNGGTFQEAIANARSRIVFTTHTPVSAGNERYPRADVQRIVPGLDDAAFELARSVDGDPTSFGLTELALRTSRSANGVSRRHGAVAREMWKNVGVSVTHVTNGVHRATWMSERMQALLQRAGGAERADTLDDAALWATRNQLRAALVEYVRTRSVEDRLARGENMDYVQAAALTFDPQVLTIGFARRVASYKRLHLLVRDAVRAVRLLHGPHPVQVVIAGKAHPADDAAKRIVQNIFTLKSADGVGAHVAFLEDHDMDMARRLVAGCDVWVNLPRPPMEASGTSGMKAAMNGALNLSTLDGWWEEAYAADPRAGWAIETPRFATNDVQDDHDAGVLYDLLEREIVPLFYERGTDGIPHAWCARIKASLAAVVPRFSAERMVDDYTSRIWAV